MGKPQKAQGPGSGLWVKFFFPTTSVIQLGISPFVWGVCLWEALFIVSQKWSFPTAPARFPFYRSGFVHAHLGTGVCGVRSAVRNGQARGLQHLLTGFLTSNRVDPSQSHFKSGTLLDSGSKCDAIFQTDPGNNAFGPSKWLLFSRAPEGSGCWRARGPALEGGHEQG